MGCSSQQHDCKIVQPAESCNLGHASLDGLRCEDCDAYCRECLSGSRIGCSSCYSGYTLRVLDTNTNTGECMQDCAKGFFRDAPNDLRCIQCGKNLALIWIHCYLLLSSPCVVFPKKTLAFYTAPLRYCLDCNSLYNCFECQVGATLFRGICYLDPSGTVDQTVDLQTYLSSGAGASWDVNDAPSWTLLTSQVRRLQDEADEAFQWDPSNPKPLGI